MSSPKVDVSVRNPVIAANNCGVGDPEKQAWTEIAVLEP
jgi:hypothetical protein